MEPSVKFPLGNTCAGPRTLVIDGNKCKINHLMSCRTSNALIKKKIKFFSYIREFRVEQLQSHI
jgi:hypothetical protein